MAPRISHSARRSSTSRWRLIVTFITGTAAPIRISRMVTTTIISRSVTPRSRPPVLHRAQALRRSDLREFICYLVYGNRRLRSQHVQRLVLAVARSGNSNGDGAGAFALSHEHQVEDRAITRDALTPCGS